MTLQDLNAKRSKEFEGLTMEAERLKTEHEMRSKSAADAATSLNAGIACTCAGIKKVSTAVHYIALLAFGYFYMMGNEYMQPCSVVTITSFILAYFVPPTGMIKPDEVPEYATKVMESACKNEEIAIRNSAIAKENIEVAREHLASTREEVRAVEELLKEAEVELLDFYDDDDW